MKRNIFKLIVSVLLLSLLVTSLVILTGCNDESGDNGDGGITQDAATVTKISIKDTEKPQTTFVLNVDPDFSAGKQAYLGSQLESDFGICFGIVANMDFLLICSYEENGENPELVIYKKR